MMPFSRGSESAGAVCAALNGGGYTAKLEKTLGKMFGRVAVATNTTDGAIHTALALCGLERGDYVFVPAYTFYSYISPVVNAGGYPVFIDSDPTTRCMSPSALETAFFWASLQNVMPRAVIIDNAFGSVADFDVLLPLCKSYGVRVIELACDALGGDHKGTPCGGNCDYGIVSLGKRTGGGGAAVILSEDEGNARAFIRAEYTDGESYDYVMPELIAALDYARLGELSSITARARNNLLCISRAVECIAPPVAGEAAAYALCRDGRAIVLRNEGFEVKRPPAVNALARYDGAPFFEHEKGFNVSEELSRGCLIGMDMSAPRRRKLAHDLVKNLGTPR